jgi:glycerate kinase
MTVRVLRDVSNPLLGPNGAARVFGPQKGALPDDVEQLERGLAHWAEVLRAASGRDVRYIPGGGAAGGLSAGLHAVLRARLVQGFAEVAKYTGLREQLAGCDLCITGEGRIDAQTESGKVVAGVTEIARELGVPVVALAGAVCLPERATLDEFAARIGLTRIRVATPDGMPIEAALAGAAANLRRAAAEVLEG